MACGACKNMRKGCKDDCCFAEFFAPEDAEMFQKLKLHFSVKVMRAMLSDAKTTKEAKKQNLQKWCDFVNAMEEEKQAGSSSSKIEKKKLQVSKYQAASSKELGCKDNCLFAHLFSPETKEIIVKIKNEQGMEWVETEVKPKLEKLWREIDEVLVAAQIICDWASKFGRPN